MIGHQSREDLLFYYFPGGSDSDTQGPAPRSTAGPTSVTTWTD